MWHAILGPAAADLSGVELLALTDTELGQYCAFKAKRAPGVIQLSLHLHSEQNIVYMRYKYCYCWSWTYRI